MDKFRNSDIKPFQFNDLKSSHVVSGSGFQNFEFKNLTGESITAEKVTEEDIRKERKHEAKNNFKIDDIVRDSRGLARQEQSDVELKIQQEVKRRLEAAY